MDYKNESIAIAWCDNGNVNGLFADSLLSTTMQLINDGVNIVGRIRAVGNQISRQRQVVFSQWQDSPNIEWLLWVDSDIVLTEDAIYKLLEVADKNEKPVVSGVYFVTYEPEKTLMTPFPSVYSGENEQGYVAVVHPLPTNEVIKIDASGFGLVLMHRSIIDNILSIEPGYSVFAEIAPERDDFVSEDMVFFRKLKKSGVQAYAHTGAIVRHMKQFSFDVDYYYLYWLGKQNKLFEKEEQNVKNDEYFSVNDGLGDEWTKIE